jgi:hypothetical protein
MDSRRARRRLMNGLSIVRTVLRRVRTWRSMAASQVSLLVTATTCSATGRRAAVYALRDSSPAPRYAVGKQSTTDTPKRKKKTKTP